MKETTFLGMPINVVEQKDIDEAVTDGRKVAYVVGRVADQGPAEGWPALLARRLRTMCEGCDHVCWIDPVGMDPLRGTNFTIVCTRCIVGEFGKQFREDQNQ